MSAQPEALRLADLLESDGWPDAAELHRRYAEIEQLREQNTALDAACAKLEKKRDKLLAALRQIFEQHRQWPNSIWAANVVLAAVTDDIGK